MLVEVIRRERDRERRQRVNNDVVLEFDRREFGDLVDEEGDFLSSGTRTD